MLRAKFDIYKNNEFGKCEREGKCLGERFYTFSVKVNQNTQNIKKLSNSVGNCIF